MIGIKLDLVRYYGGLALVAPIFSVIFLFFTLANMSLPGKFQLYRRIFNFGRSLSKEIV
jgi:NADH:ubiquinone oxidoreductase subunit 4 (subunit M)